MTTGHRPLDQNLLQPADWTFPVPVAYGPGRLDELGRRCTEAGLRRPLVVTDRGSLDLPFVDQALGSLSAAGLHAAVFADVAPNPTDRDVAAGREVFRSGSHDGVVAIGGGSGMDAGKAISLVAANDVDLQRFDYDLGDSPNLDAGPHQAPTGLVPLFTVPTTAGTGAETESTAMITDLERGIKICVWHPAQKPTCAILDPTLTVGLPPTLTAWTGIDALVHAIEAYSVADWHPMCDGIALEAMRLVARWLPAAFDDGENLEARAGMLVGSCLAGISFLKGLGLVHGMSHMIGAVYDTHHGLTNAVLLPPVLRYNRDVLGTKAEAMARAVGADRPDFDGLYDQVVTLLDRLAVPTSLAGIGVEAGGIPDVAAKVMLDAATGTNPRSVTQAEVEAMLDRALETTR